MFKTIMRCVFSSLLFMISLICSGQSENYKQTKSIFINKEKINLPLMDDWQEISSFNKAKKLLNLTSVESEYPLALYVKKPGGDIFLKDENQTKINTDYIKVWTLNPDLNRKLNDSIKNLVMKSLDKKFSNIEWDFKIDEYIKSHPNVFNEDYPTTITLLDKKIINEKLILTMFNVANGVTTVSTLSFVFIKDMMINIATYIPYENNSTIEKAHLVNNEFLSLLESIN